MIDTPIVEARVLSYYDNPIRLNENINNLLKDGWVLHGPISVTEFSCGGLQKVTLVYTQVMTKQNVSDPLSLSVIPNLEPMREDW